MNVDPADVLGIERPVHLVGHIVGADERPRSVDNPDSGREAAQDRLKLRLLDTGNRLGRNGGALPGFDLRQCCLGLRPAVLLKLADRLGSGLGQDLVDRLQSCLEPAQVPLPVAGVFEGRAGQCRPQMRELVNNLADVVALAPAEPTVLFALGGGVGRQTAQPLAQPVEQGGDVVEELPVGELFGLGNVANPLDRRPPDSEDQVGLLVEMIRQQGGLAHVVGLRATIGVARTGNWKANSARPHRQHWFPGTQAVRGGRAQVNLSIGHRAAACQAERNGVVLVWAEPQRRCQDAFRGCRITPWYEHRVPARSPSPWPRSDHF